MAFAAITIADLSGRRDVRRWARQGAFSGAIAGFVFAAFEMAAAAALDGRDAVLTPMRRVGAMVLGPEALVSNNALIATAVVGIAVHMSLSAAFGSLFGLVASAVPALASSRRRLVHVAGYYGLLLWIVNFYAVAPAAGWNWFPQGSVPIVQLVAHAAVFGVFLGLMLDRGISRSTSFAASDLNGFVWAREGGTR